MVIGEDSYMRKLLGVIALILAMLFSLCGCGASKSSDDVIDMTSNWKIAVVTTNSGTTDLREEPWYMHLIFAKANPKFKCDDFGNCELSINGKTREGVVTDLGDGQYTIDFYSADRSRIASTWNVEIVDDTMTMTSESGEATLVFEVK